MVCTFYCTFFKKFFSSFSFMIIQINYLFVLLYFLIIILQALILSVSIFRSLIYILYPLYIRIVSDLMDEKVYLISSAEEGSICIVTLMLTGRATPNLHNGIVNIGDEQHYVSYIMIRINKINNILFYNIQLFKHLFIFRQYHIMEY